MDKEERIRIEITNNTLRSLLFEFDGLLLGLDTSKYSFESSLDKNIKIKKIKNFVEYRLKEKVIDQNGDLGMLMKEIKNGNIGVKKTARGILKKLIHIYTKNNYPTPISLKSKEANRISKYLKQKACKNNMKIGEGVLSRFFRFVGK